MRAGHAVVTVSVHTPVLDKSIQRMADVKLFEDMLEPL